jgi:methionyl-tRNA synthetase
MSKPYYVTTPIYYVNDLPHIGAALTTLCCDALARYHHLRGRATWFLTGTDENATKVQDAAAKAGVPTQEFVAGLSEAFRACWDTLHVGYNDFIRTTEPRHTRAVQVFFDRLIERGFVYQDTYEGWYSVSDETFFRDSDVENGIAKETGKPVVRVTEDNYFFRLSAFGDRLLEQIETHPDWLQPEFRRNEVIAFIKEGLRDISISRPNRGWGIPFAHDPSKVIYVWVDALINYLSATGWPDNPDWDKLWPADLHFMGKEIFVRFHATLWPAMLMALDLPVPNRVYAHGFWTVGGVKGGKTGPSLPHPVRFAQLLADRSGAEFDMAVDALRYLLCREMNFGQDTEFTVENFLRRFNSDLANDLGNLLNRTVSMMGKYYDGIVPATNQVEAEFAALTEEVRAEYAQAMSDQRLNAALEACWRIVGRMNKYIDERAPWALAKAAKEGDAASADALALTLTSCLEATRVVSILIGPFMPMAADAIRRQLGLTRPVRDTAWEETEWQPFPAGIKVGPPQPVFPRIQDLTVTDETYTQLRGTVQAPAVPKENQLPVSETPAPAGSAPAPSESAAPAESLINIEDFMKVQLRVGEILAAEPIPNANKLLRLTVDLGEQDPRTILAGIAEFYPPEALVGRQVVVVANLQPRKMRGIESQGMLLAADVEGRAILLQPDEVVPLGARVR